MTVPRDVRRRLDDLQTEGPPGGDYPTVSLADLLAAAEDDAIELANEDRRLYRVNGHVREVPRKTLEVLETLAERGDSP